MKDQNKNQNDGTAKPSSAAIVSLQLNKLIELFNIGYHKGHHDTVESCYIDIKNCDMNTYHSDIIKDILKDI